MNALVVALFVAGTGFLVYWIVFMVRRARDTRTSEMTQLAERLGFEFLAGAFDGASLDRIAQEPLWRRLETWHPFGVGIGRGGQNLLVGERGGVSWLIFDYSFVVPAGESATPIALTAVMARFDSALPELSLRKEGLLDHIKELAGFHDLHMDHKGFDDMYHVKAADPDQAKDVLTDSVVETLLAIKHHAWQFSSGVLVGVHQGHQPIDDIEGTMRDALAILASLPVTMRPELEA